MSGCVAAPAELVPAVEDALERVGELILWSNGIYGSQTAVQGRKGGEYGEKIRPAPPQRMLIFYLVSPLGALTPFRAKVA